MATSENSENVLRLEKAEGSIQEEDLHPTP